MEQDIKFDIETAMQGKLWAYTPVINKDGTGLGIAVANEAGYSPISLWHYSAKTWKEAYEKARELNVEQGKTEDECLNIIASSMAEGSISRGVFP